MTILIVARHGNTFESGEPPRRVGKNTDLPLTGKGREQARAIGLWLKESRLMPDAVYSSTLQRTVETAKLAVAATGVAQPVYRLNIFDEIDYGPDENKTEDEVLARVGSEAIRAWDHEGIVPPGWRADPAEIIRNWRGFAERIREHDDGEVVLAVTSNGIARFAPLLAGVQTSPKLSTGALGILRYAGEWHREEWNLIPPLPPGEGG